MSETTHTLLDAVADLLSAHGYPTIAVKIRLTKKHIADVPIAERAERPKISEVFQAMADRLIARHNMTSMIPQGGSGGYSGMEHRERDLDQAQIYAAIAKIHRDYGQ